MTTSFISDQDFTTPAHIRHAVRDEDPPDPARRGTSAAPFHALTFLTAIWLVVSAVPLGYLSVARYDVFWCDAVIGITIAVVTIMRLARGADVPAMGWVTAGLGGWLLIAPLALRYGWTTATLNDIVVGLLVLGLTALGTADPEPNRR